MTTQGSPITTGAKDAIQRFTRDAVGSALDAAFQVATDFPGALASSDNFLGPLVVAKPIIRLACRRVARGGGPANNLAFQAGMRSICAPYLGTLGEDISSDGEVGPPYAGGQCAVFYRVAIDYRRQGFRCSDGVLTFSDSNLRTESPAINRIGPISYAGRSVLSTGNCGPIRYGFNFLTGNNSAFQVAPSGVNQTQRLELADLNIRMVRVDGQLDNCGNTGPEYRPPRYPFGLPPVAPVPVEFPDGSVTGVDVGFDDDGNVIVNFPDLGLTVTVPNPLAGSSSSEGGEDEGEDPGFQGVAGAPSGATSGAAEGEDPDRELVGVLVSTLGIPARANRNFNSTEAYTKGAYYVFLGGVAGLELQINAAVSRSDQFFYAPKSANRFRVVANAGFSINVIPFWRE